jgi:hypothetical protein
MSTVYCCGKNQPAKEFKFRKTDETILKLECCYKCKNKRVTTSTVKLNAKESRKFWNKYKTDLKEIKVRQPQTVMNTTWIHGDSNPAGTASTPKYLEKGISAGKQITDLFFNSYFDKSLMHGIA